MNEYMTSYLIALTIILIGYLIILYFLSEIHDRLKELVNVNNNIANMIWRRNHK